MTSFVQKAIRLGLLALFLVRNLNHVVTSEPTKCTINAILVESSDDTTSGSTTEVNIRSLADCHKDEEVAETLKTATPEGAWRVPTIYTRLTHVKYGEPYARSCRSNLLK